MGNKETTPKEPVQSASDKMLDMLYEFKFMAKNLRKESTKAENQEKQFILKVKEAIEKNMPETAKIHAADAIRKKMEAKRYLTLSSKLDAVHARLQSAYQTQRLTENMQDMTGKLFSALGTMDLVKVNETMGTFETMFDNLDVNNTLMNQVFDNVNAGTYNEKEVNGLIGQVAEEFNMKLEGEFSDISVKNKASAQKEEQKNVISNSNVGV